MGSRCGQIPSIVARLPQRELEIRRRCAQSVQFRSVCADFEEAAKALRYWQGAGRGGDRMVEEYIELLGELEAEILAQLGDKTANS